MALNIADRVKESSTSTGTGTLTLGGAVSGFQSFATIGNGNQCYYTIVHNSLDEWEVGVGTYTVSGTTLSRDTVLDSSSGGAKVSFSVGNKEVFVTYPADRSVSQTDIGTAPNEIPLNQYLGDLAYQNLENLPIPSLDAATTPLAGTEVLPVVQSGVTKKVDVANLTTGRTVAMDKLAVGNIPSPTLLAEFLSNTDAEVRISNGGGLTPAPMLTLYRQSGVAARFFYDPADKVLYCRNDFATGQIVFQQGSTTIASFNASGNFAPAAGKGIDFSADGQAAGMTSELLDDYEEGTWTPVIIGTTTAGTGTYTTQIGTYTKVGRQVTVNVELQWTAHTGTGNMRIQALPFVPDGHFSCAIGRFTDITMSANNTPYAFTLTGETPIELGQQPTGGGARAGIPMDTTGFIRLTVTYFV